MKPGYARANLRNNLEYSVVSFTREAAEASLSGPWPTTNKFDGEVRDWSPDVRTAVVKMSLS